MSQHNAEWVVVGKGGKPKINKQKKKINYQNNDSNNIDNEKNFSNQDWNNVKFTKQKKQKNTVVVNKFTQNNSTNNSIHHLDSKKIKKIEELHEMGDYSLEKPSKKLQETLISGRNALNLSQEDFAKLCNIQANIIRSYERGTLVPTGEHLNIMSKKLGITLSKY